MAAAVARARCACSTSARQRLAELPRSARRPRGRRAGRSRRSRRRTRAAAAYLDSANRRFQRVVASFESLPIAGGELRPRRVQRLAALRPRSAATLREARRVARGGPHRHPRFAVLRSRGRRRGRWWRRNGASRGAVRRAGRRALSLPFIEYLTPARLDGGVATTRARVARHRVRYPLWYELRPLARDLRGRRAPSRFDLWECSGRMILFVNPRATRPTNRRFPLSIMAVGAALPDDETLGDRRRQPAERGSDWPRSSARIEARRGGAAIRVRMVAFTVMPGPQLVSAVPLSRATSRRAFREVPIVWGGNFPSLYPVPILNAPYVDWVVRGQGEETFVELLEVLDGARDPKTVRGLCFRNRDGSHWIGEERRWKGPDELPAPPYHRIPVRRLSAADLPRPALGRLPGVHRLSVRVQVLRRHLRVRQPGKTAGAGAHRRASRASSRAQHGMDSLHFYDNNFFVKEDHARELAGRIAPLGLRWWCEARVDALTRFTDDTWRLLQARRADDGVLRRGVGVGRGAQEDEEGYDDGADPRGGRAVARARDHPRVLVRFRRSGRAGARDRQHARVHPPAQGGESGDGADQLLLHAHPAAPWHVRRRRRAGGNARDARGVDRAGVGRMDDARGPTGAVARYAAQGQGHDFEVVLKSRFPSVQDRRTAAWGKALGRMLARRRWSSGNYANPSLLRAVRRLATRVPDDTQAYGHLRPATSVSAPSNGRSA